MNKFKLDNSEDYEKEDFFTFFDFVKHFILFFLIAMFGAVLMFF